MRSQAEERCLAAIGALKRENHASFRVTVSRLADALGVSAATATETVRGLAQVGLVRHNAYRGVDLTIAGEQAVVEVLRAHRSPEP